MSRVGSAPHLDGAVASAFANAPFPAELRATWPRVSVVVCAYNAADTLEDNLSSLEQLTYPDYEIILVNDGSRDRTGEIGRAHPHVRVIDIPNGGLSAARNVGLAEATGEIVAYTDADTRVDRDWLTYLVQPFLTLDGLRMARHLMFFNDAKARRELVYSTRPYRDGIADAIAWFRQHGYLR